MASLADTWHRAAVGQAQALTTLQLAQQHSGLDAGGGRKGRRLLIWHYQHCHPLLDMLSNLTIPKCMWAMGCLVVRHIPSHFGEKHHSKQALLRVKYVFSYALLWLLHLFTVKILF
jgi:hypothetical protein